MKCRVERKKGRVFININNTNYFPLAFKTFRACDKNISDFYNAGIRLFNVLTGSITSAIGLPYSLFGETWLDDEIYDFKPIDEQIDLFIKNAPESYLSVMLQVDTRDWWLQKRKGYPNSFTHMAHMEADGEWRDLAGKYIQAAINHIEKKYGEKVFGYFLLGGTTTEWFSEYTYEYPSKLTEREFKKWTGIENRLIPNYDERETDKDVVFLGEDLYKNLIDYRKFEAWQRTDTIEYFVNKAQEILKHKKLLGLYYGYIFELENQRLWDTGYLNYERIFISKDIDMISSPMSYSYRAQDDSSEGMVADATLSLHDKIDFLEHDQTTCILPDEFEGKRFVHPNKAETIEEDINLLRRDFMLAFGNGIAMWWFDMLGGWWYDDRFMEEIKKMILISNTLSDKEYKPLSEVAVIVDPESMYYVNKNSGINNMALSEQRRELSYLGVPYDLYSTCDLKNIDIEKYKVYIFLCNFKNTDELVEFSEKLKRENKTMIFSYACNLVKEKVDLTCMSKLLGFEIDKNECFEKTMLMDGQEYSCSQAVECFQVVGDAIKLGYYKESRNCSAAYKKDGYLTVFSGLPMIHKELIRKILEMSAVHMYFDNYDNLIYPNNLGMGIYHRIERDAIIHLKEDDAFVDIFDGKEYLSKEKTLFVSYSGKRAKLLIRKSALE
ncbi:MAG: hypothetical protein EGR97_05080 [Clostridiales bacterium]|nr:hypothetical protein [Clostridiales bacterium]